VRDGTERWLAAGIAAVLLSAWELAARLGLVSATFFPPPSTIGMSLSASITSGVMLEHLRVTLLRVFPGLLIGGGPGLLLGLAMGSSARLRGIMDPFIAAVHPVPKLALLPLFMVLLGIGEQSKILVVAAAAFFPMLLNAMAGVRHISPVHFEVAENYGAGRTKILVRVVLPGSLPMVLTGLRLAANIAFLSAIGVEIAAAETGLGALIWLSWEVLRVEQLYATLFVTGLLGVALNATLQWLARRLVPWLAEQEHFV
jgi:NitT/TauT family transport system permease protein